MSKKKDTIAQLNALEIEGLVIASDTELTQSQLDMITNAKDSPGLALELYTGMIAQIEVQENAKTIADLSLANESLADKVEGAFVTHKKTDYEVVAGIRLAGKVYTKAEIAKNPTVSTVKGDKVDLLDYILKLKGQNVLIAKSE